MSTHNTNCSRRTLLKGVAATMLAPAIIPFNRLSATEIQQQQDILKQTWSACTVNCGSRCPLRMTTKNGEIIYVETDNTGTDTYDSDHQVRACLRGRSMRRRIYSPDRLKYPMMRDGARGSGQFKKISWDDAFKAIANSIKSIQEKYGNEAFYLNYGTGTLGGTVTKSWPPATTLIARLMNSFKSLW